MTRPQQPSDDHSIAVGDDDVATQLGALAASDQPTVEQLRRFGTTAARSARTAGTRAVASGRWLADTTLEAASHVPLRDHPTLVEHHYGLDGPALAATLIRNASLASAAVGAGFGALAAVSEATPATWTALPFELVAETLAVVAIELKLVGELHAVADRPVEGSPSQRATSLAQAWAENRGITPDKVLLRGGKALDVVSRRARQRLLERLRKRLLQRAGRNLATWVPFFAGAVAGGELNRRATRKIGRKIAADLDLV
ncbi:MAG: hypothetical protein ACRD0U_02895 [Acidimicrobiales bacterium]